MKKSRSNLLLFIVICFVIAGVLEWQRYSDIKNTTTVHNVESVNQDADYAEPATINLKAQSFEMQVINLGIVCLIIAVCFVPCVAIAKSKNMFVLSRNAHKHANTNETQINKKVEIGA